MSDTGYFSRESESKYMSNHQYSAFQFCEHRAYAQFVTGEYAPEPSDAFKAGLLVESYLQDVPCVVDGLYKKDGKLYAQFASCEAQAAKGKADKLFMTVCSGEMQKELYGEIHGHPFKAKLDYINVEKGWITDLKTARDFCDDWAHIDGTNKKVPWYEVHNYWRQLAIYGEIARQNYKKDFELYIAAISKQDPPDIVVIQFNNPKRIRLELMSLMSRLDRIKSVKAGKCEPTRCEACDHCRKTKKLSKIEQAKNIYE